MTSYQEFEDALICALAEATDNHGGGAFNLRDVAESRDFYFDDDWLAIAQAQLLSNKYIRTSRNISNGNFFVSITDRGRQHVSSVLSKNNRTFDKIEISRAEIYTLGCLMFELDKGGGDGYLSADEFVKKYLYFTTPDSFRSVSEELVAANLLQKRELPSGVAPLKEISEYRVAPLGIYYVLSNLQYFYDQTYGITFDFPDIIVDYISSLDDKYERIYPDQSPFNINVAVPAADRIVNLDHNSQDYKNTISTIDNLITALESQNYFENESQEEITVLVESVRGARQILNLDRVTVGTIRSLVLPPLQYIADNFAKGALAAIGAVAVAAVLKLLGAI